MLAWHKAHRSQTDQRWEPHKIYFNLCGKSRFIVYANSPSDWRAEHNNRSTVATYFKTGNMELSK